MSARRVAIGVVVLGLLAVLGLAALLLRPPVRVGVGEVMVECAASTGLSPSACSEWGNGTLAAGPPSRTFEMDDVRRLSLERGWLGLGSCEARYFTTRYPDRPVWTDEVACPG